MEQQQEPEGRNPEVPEAEHIQLGRILVELPLEEQVLLVELPVVGHPHAFHDGHLREEQEVQLVERREDPLVRDLAASMEVPSEPLTVVVRIREVQLVDQEGAGTEERPDIRPVLRWEHREGPEVQTDRRSEVPVGVRHP